MTRRDVPSCGSCGYVGLRMTLSWAVTGEPMRSGRCRQCGRYTCSRGHPSDGNTATWLSFTRPLVRDPATGDLGPGQLSLPVCRTGDCVKVLRGWRGLTDYLEKLGPEEVARRLTAAIRKHESSSWQMDLLQTFKCRHGLKLAVGRPTPRTAVEATGDATAESPQDHYVAILARETILTTKQDGNLRAAIDALTKYGTADDRRWIDTARTAIAEPHLEELGIFSDVKLERWFKPFRKTRAQQNAEFEVIYGPAALAEWLDEEASNRARRRASSG